MKIENLINVWSSSVCETYCMTEVSCYMEIYISLHERIKITSFCCFCLVSPLSLLSIFMYLFTLCCLCICKCIYFLSHLYIFRLYPNFILKNRFIVSFFLRAQPMNDMVFYKTTHKAFCPMKSRANMTITYMFNRAHVLEC
mgnify:CR=1 FL=1